MYVVWRYFLSENREIAYRSSTDASSSFGHIKNLSNTPGWSDNPAISASGNNLYLVWEDPTGIPDEFNTLHDDILYRQSIDQGETINLSANAGDSSRPDLASLIQG